MISSRVPSEKKILREKRRWGSNSQTKSNKLGLPVFRKTEVAVVHSVGLVMWSGVYNVVW